MVSVAYIALLTTINNGAKMGRSSSQEVRHTMSTEQTSQPEASVAHYPLEAGTILKQKRQELGLTQRQIADQLNLRLAIIEHLESNQFEFGQVTTFVRGYLRTYARAVGADEKQVLSAFDSTAPLLQQEEVMHSFSGKVKREKHDGRLMLVTWGIFAVIIGISSVWWWQNQTQDTLRVSEESVQQSSESAAQVSTSNTMTQNDHSVAAPSEEITAESHESADGVQTDDPAPTAERPQLVQNQNEEQGTGSVSASQSEAQSSDSSLADESKLVAANALHLSFSGDCWVQIKDATGKTLFSGVKGNGQSLSLKGETPYHIVLGAHNNVSMTFASEPVDLSGYTSGKVARLTLP